MRENLDQFRIIVLIEAPRQKVSITRVLEFEIFSYKNFLKINNKKIPYMKRLYRKNRNDERITRTKRITIPTMKEFFF